MRQQHKVCPRCKRSKSCRSFGKRPSGYLKSLCKICSREKQKEYTLLHIDKIQTYLLENKEIVRERKLNWYKKHPDYNHSYYLANKDVIQKQKAEYDKKKRATDPCYKLRKNLRTRLYHALKGQTKNGSAVKDMGCTVEELKQYLESKFQHGMTWNNYGSMWQIDHVIPLVKFNLVQREELLKACHYTNLQPLWTKENLKKGKKG